MQSQLTNSNSLHPTLWLNLPQSVLNTGCEPTLLIHLPAGVFYDPFTAHNPIITQGRTSKRGYNVELLTSTDDQIELEGAVGWTARRKAKAQATWFGTDQDAEVEEEQAQHEFGEEGTEEILQSLLREFSGGEQMRPGTAKIRHGVKNAAAATTQPKTAKAKAKVEIFGVEQAKDEVSTLMIRLNIDELRSADGMVKLEIPLHTRYHPPQMSTDSSSKSTLPWPHSPYLTLLEEILPTALTKAFTQTKLSLLNLLGQPSFPTSSSNDLSSSSSKRSSGYVNVFIQKPTLYLTCSHFSDHSAIKYIQGFFSTTLTSIFPHSHSHLFSKVNNNNNNNNKVLVFMNDNNDDDDNIGELSSLLWLQLEIPVAKQEILPSVQLITLFTILTTCLFVMHYLYAIVLPTLQAVEITF